MNQFDIDKSYSSPYDQFLRKFDSLHEKTPSQLKEIQKHERIAALRDQVAVLDDKKDIWPDF